MATKKENKTKLGELLAIGLAPFGKVAPRKPHRDEEDTGDGAPGLTVETHPMLAELPVGAASDLTFIASENSNITDEALAREEELTPALRNQPSLQNQPTPQSTPKLVRH